jgi:vacuolar-type H+-ATPase subunit H
MAAGDEWTIATLKTYYDALLVADEKLRTERDRRYTEVGQERERALKIKEQADRDALMLAREIQTYKDEKANELREQINRERGLYVTHDELKSTVDKIEALIKPLTTYVSSQQGRSSGIQASTATLVTIILVAVAVMGLVIRFLPIGT